MKKKIAGLLSLCLAVVLGAVVLTGCGAGFDPEKPIAVVVRETASGTRGAFMEIIGLTGKDDPTGVITAPGTPQVLAEVRGNPQAIAYESLGYVTSEVKKLKINGVEATVANIINNTYPIARPLSVVYLPATLDNPLFAAFHTFLLSSEAQVVIRDMGYVDVNNANATAYAKPPLSGGTINISGSTTVQPLMDVLAEMFEDLHSGVTVVVAGGGSGTGRTQAQNGTSNFGMISNEFETGGTTEGLEFTMVGGDGIAVIVNTKNTYDNLTLAQLKNIYDRDAENRITKWADLA
ncbi:MAG: substrate-binding domain-containing protein [Firmicutes bacterium]|nr:substrate-binding domain-containing protein [Bacillota bacterium]